MITLAQRPPCTVLKTTVSVQCFMYCSVYLVWTESLQKNSTTVDEGWQARDPDSYHKTILYTVASDSYVILGILGEC